MFPVVCALCMVFHSKKCSKVVGLTDYMMFSVFFCVYGTWFMVNVVQRL